MPEPVWCVWLYEVAQARVLCKLFASRRGAHMFLREQGWRVDRARQPRCYVQAHADMDAMLEAKVVGGPDASIRLEEWEVYGG